MSTQPFQLHGLDGKLIRGDRVDGRGRQILFITGFLSKRWGNKSKAPHDTGSLPVVVKVTNSLLSFTFDSG